MYGLDSKVLFDVLLSDTSCDLRAEAFEDAVVKQAKDVLHQAGVLCTTIVARMFEKAASIFVTRIIIMSASAK